MKTAFIILFLWLIQGCSADISKEETKISVKVMSINAWYNLMPGGPSSFHVGGEVLLNSNSGILRDIKLDKITIIRQGEEIYYIVPSFEAVTQDSVNILATNKQYRFIFGTKPGLSIHGDINDTQLISAVLHFSIDETEIECTVDSLEIEKAY